MKKLLIVNMLVFITFIFISCGKTPLTEKEKMDVSDTILHSEASEIDEISNNNLTEEATDVNDTLPPSFRYTPFSESPKIGEILNNNLIDKLCFEESKSVVTTGDIVNLYQKYLDIWQNELNIVVEKIETNISDEKLEEFQISQDAWETLYKTNPNIAVYMYCFKMGQGTIIHSIYGEKALYMIRYRTLELAEFCYLLTGEFSFEFDQK